MSSKLRVKFRGDVLSMCTSLAAIAACGSSACAPSAHGVGEQALAASELRSLDIDTIVGSELVTDVTWASSSSVLVALSGGSELVRLDWSSGAIERVARRGAGPQETQRTQWLLRRGDGTIVSVDEALLRMSRRDELGSLLSSTSLVVASITGAWMTDRGLVVKTSSGGTRVEFVLLDDSATVAERREFPADRQSGTATCDFCPPP